MSKFSFLYWSALCFTAGYYWAADDDARRRRRELVIDAYDRIVDYTAARAAVQRRRSEAELELLEAAGRM